MLNNEGGYLKYSKCSPSIKSTKYITALESSQHCLNFLLFLGVLCVLACNSLRESLRRTRQRLTRFTSLLYSSNSIPMKTQLIIFFTVALFIGYPSCHCPDFYLITGVGRCLFSDHDSQILVEGGEITTDSLHVLVFIDVEAYTDSGWPPDPGLMPEADALNCVTPLANSIQSLTFFSDVDFNDIPAGQSLNPKLWSTNYNTPLDSLPFLFAETTYDFELRMMFLEKPVQKTHTFSIVMIDNAGNSFYFLAQPLTWL